MKMKKGRRLISMLMLNRIGYNCAFFYDSETSETEYYIRD